MDASVDDVLPGCGIVVVRVLYTVMVCVEMVYTTEASVGGGGPKVMNPLSSCARAMLAKAMKIDTMVFVCL
jgi:hypothetical protein